MRKKTALFALSAIVGVIVPFLTGGFLAQERISPPGEWWYQSGDAWGTRF